MPNVAQAETPRLPLPPDQEHGSLSYWQRQIQCAEDKRKEYKERDWDRNVQAYQGKTLETRLDYDVVTVPKDFANVERKKAELFFQNPEVNLAPKMPGLEDAVSIFQAVLNHQLGPDGVDAGAMMVECTFDVQVTGLMCTKIGYESFAGSDQQIQIGEREATPAQPLPGSVLGLGPEVPPQMEPVFASVPQIVSERYFWQRISPARVLIPADFEGFNFDRAPWLGFEFDEDWAVLQRRYNLPNDLKAKGSEILNKLKSETFSASTAKADERRVRGWEIWYRASRYDPAIVHPEHLRYLVLLEGMEDPVAHTDSPYQTIGPDGSVTGMKGFPVHLGTVRYVSDTAYPMPETTVGRQQVMELGKSRTQMINQRDRNVPLRWADPGRIGGEPTVEQIRKNLWQAIVMIPGADANNLPIGEIPRSSYPPEDFQFNSIIERDLDEIWAFGANQRGMETSERKTATEIRNIQANVSARMEYERRQIIRFYVKGVEKLGALLQKFADQQDYIEIVGPDGFKRLETWNKDAIAGDFVYDARPDSAVRINADQEFKDLTELYNLTAKDDRANRVEILTKIARLKNLDPTRFILPPPPPTPPPPPSLGFSFKGEDLNPLLPQAVTVYAILQKAGIEIPPAVAQLLQQGQPPQPPAVPEGTAPQADRLSQHAAENTGELSGPPTDQEG